jgi:hypothetical protein
MTKKFYDIETLLHDARAVYITAGYDGASVALVGGLALQHLGSDRLTGDVDFVSDLVPGGFEGKPLSFGGKSGFGPSGVPVDLIVRDDEYAALYREALEKSRFSRTLEMSVVRPEYLTAMKMAAGRPKDEIDLLFLLTSDKVNLPVAREIVLQHLGVYAAREFDAILLEAQWRKSRGDL